MIAKFWDMKNCVDWWFTTKNFGSKCHCKKRKKNAIMTILLFLDRKENYYHIRIITGKVPIQDLDGSFFDFWVKVELRLSHIWTRPDQKLISVHQFDLSIKLLLNIVIGFDINTRKQHFPLCWDNLESGTWNLWCCYKFRIRDWNF